MKFGLKYFTYVCLFCDSHLIFDTEEILLLPFQTKLRFHSLGPIYLCASVVSASV